MCCLHCSLCPIPPPHIPLFSCQLYYSSVSPCPLFCPPKRCITLLLSFYSMMMTSACPLFACKTTPANPPTTIQWPCNFPFSPTVQRSSLLVIYHSLEFNVNLLKLIQTTKRSPGSGISGKVAQESYPENRRRNKAKQPSLDTHNTSSGSTNWY